MDYINENDSEFIKEVKREVVERLEDFIGREHYVCDIGFLLTENENNSGSWYCSSHKAEEFLKKYFNEIGMYHKFYRLNFDENDYFEIDPDDYHHSMEAFQCRMMIFAIESCFSRAVSEIDDVDNIWDDKIEITEEFVEKIKNALTEIKEVEDIW